MNLGAQEAAVLADLTSLFQDKGKWFAERTTEYLSATFWHQSQYKKQGTVLGRNTRQTRKLSQWKHHTIAWRQPRQMWDKTDKTYKFSLIVFTAFSLCFLWGNISNIVLYWEVERKWKPDEVLLCVHMRALLEVITRLSAILFHLLKKVLGIS